MNSDMALLDTPITISEINSMLKSIVNQSFYNICLSGEVSSLKPSSNRHLYFTLKDSSSQINAVIFNYSRVVDFDLTNGDEVIVNGNIDVYIPRGTYQIIISSIKKKGEGSLLAELEKRKAYYRSLGYFDPDKKKEIPKIVKSIGLITASTGAAVQDMLSTTKERAPGVNIVIYPSLVQGNDAAMNIANQINKANEMPIVDVLIVGRGGGSIEDLLPFSENAVIEAIHNSDIPIISAVGHEIDWALSDFVADKRAITPTEGASIATEGVYNLRKELSNFKTINYNLILNKYQETKAKVININFLKLLVDRKLNINIPKIESKSLEYKLYDKIQTLDLLDEKIKILISDKMNVNIIKKEDLTSFMSQKITKSETCLDFLHREIEALNPLDILKRGYSIVKDSSGKIIKSTDDIKIDDIINIKLNDGEIITKVKGVKK